MRMTEISFGEARPVDGYGPGFFRIGGAVVEGALLTGRGGTRAWGGFADTAALVALAGEADVVLIGTGAEMAPLPVAFRAALEAAGLGIEPMNSPAVS